MFAPKVAKPQTKAAADSTNSLARPRSTLTARSHCPVEQALLLQRTIGNQATLRLLAHRDSGLTRNAFRGDHEHETTLENMTDREKPCGVAWDFSKIPVFAPGRPPTCPPLRRQPELSIGAVNDPLEQEADRVAEQVMRMPSPEVVPSSTPAQASRKCAAKEADEEEKLQKKEAGMAEAAGEAPASVGEVLRSPGEPLDDATRAYFEPRFGHDFSHVRLHTGAAAEQSARTVNANAYTVGHDIALGAGLFAPGTTEGRRLLAHELAHVVQQERGGVSPRSLSGGVLEGSAETAASGSVGGHGPIRVSGACAPGLARQPQSGLQSLGLEKPQSLTVSLDKRNLDYAALTREIKLILDWLSIYPSAPESKFLRSELKDIYAAVRRLEAEGKGPREGSIAELVGMVRMGRIDVDPADTMREFQRATLTLFTGNVFRGDIFFGDVGHFDAEYAPSKGRLTISVPVHFTFEDSWSESTRGEGDPKNNKPFTLVTERVYKQWNSPEKENWRKKFIKMVQYTWSSEHTQHTIYCHKPGWETLKAKVVVKVDEVTETTPGAANFQAEVYRGDIPEALCGSASLECVKKGREILQYDAVEGDASIAAHEFGHMLGLGDEYKSDPIQAPEASHSPAVYKEFGYGVPRLDQLRTDRFRKSIMMSAGGEVLPEHGVVFLEAMRQITGMEEWHLRPKGP